MSRDDAMIRSLVTTKSEMKSQGWIKAGLPLRPLFTKIQSWTLLLEILYVEEVKSWYCSSSGYQLWLPESKRTTTLFSIKLGFVSIYCFDLANFVRRSYLIAAQAMMRNLSMKSNWTITGDLLICLEKPIHLSVIVWIWKEDTECFRV